MKHVLSHIALAITLFFSHATQSHNQTASPSKHRPHFRTSDNDNSTLLISVTHEQENQEESGNSHNVPTNENTDNESINDIFSNPEFSSHVDNLNDFSQEISVDEAMHYFILFIESILNNPDLANKEAMHAYLTEHLTDLFKGQKFLFSVSLTAQKKSAPQESLDEESQIVIRNFADIACNFFNIVKDPNSPENVATGLKGMLGGLVNIAVFATKKSRSCDDNLDRLQLHIQHEAV